MFSRKTMRFWVILLSCDKSNLIFVLRIIEFIKLVAKKQLNALQASRVIAFPKLV